MSLCKPGRLWWRLGPLPALLAGLLLGCGLPGCGTASRTHTVTLSQLEAAPAVGQMRTARAVASNPDELRELCIPLGSRLGLIEVHAPGDWARLRTAVPDLGSCPDLRLGTLVGLACWVGTPVSTQWPIRIEDVRVCDGAGIVTGEFAGGTYLPDGATFIELAQVPGLVSVLVVDVDGTKFYPDQHQ